MTEGVDLTHQCYDKKVIGAGASANVYEARYGGPIPGLGCPHCASGRKVIIRVRAGVARTGVVRVVRVRDRASATCSVLQGTRLGLSLELGPRVPAVCRKLAVKHFMCDEPIIINIITYLRWQ